MKQFLYDKFIELKYKIKQNKYVIKHPKEIKYTSIALTGTFMFYIIRRKYKKRLIKKILLDPKLFLNSDSLLNKSQIYEKILLNNNINSSILNLFNGLLIDDDFRRNMNFFVKDIAINLINDEDFKNLFHKNLYEALNRREMKNEITNLINSISNYERSNKILQNYLTRALESKKVKDSFQNLITDSTIEVINLPKTKNIFSDFIVDVCMNSSLKWIFLKKSFSIWRPFSRVKFKYNDKNIKH